MGQYLINMNAKEHAMYHAGKELYAKMKLGRIMDDRIAELVTRKGELDREVIKLFEKHFKIKGD